jgi:hypothetical protein
MEHVIEPQATKLRPFRLLAGTALGCPVAGGRTKSGASAQKRCDRIEPRRPFDGHPMRVRGRGTTTVVAHLWRQLPGRQKPENSRRQRKKCGAKINVFFHLSLQPAFRQPNPERRKDFSAPCGVRFTDLVRAFDDTRGSW